jgi:acyl carrier protein
VADSIEDRIKQFIVNELGVNQERVIPNARLIEDLGADSLCLLTMKIRLEDEFGIVIPIEVAEKILTVGDVLDFVKEHQQ